MSYIDGRGWRYPSPTEEANPSIFDGRGWGNPAPPSGGGRTLPPIGQRTPEENLRKLQSFIGEDGKFVWAMPPGTGPRGRGVYPTWRHVSGYYYTAVRYNGQTEEDVGFTLQDLYDVWHDYVEEKWPGHALNNALFEQSYEHQVFWSGGFNPGYPHP